MNKIKMSKKVWYEIYAYGQIRESEKTLLAKIKGYVETQLLWDSRSHQNSSAVHKSCYSIKLMKQWTLLV